MTDDGWLGHVLDRVERLPYEHFRELVVDLWGLRGFNVAGMYEGDGAEFVAYRGPRGARETEVVGVYETAGVEEERALAEAADGFDGARAVAVAKAFVTDGGDEAEGRNGRNDVERVDAEAVARLVDEGGFYWTFYRWVALSEADEPDVVGTCEAPVRFGDRGGAITVGRATAKRLGADDGDVVRVAGEAAGAVERGGVFEMDRDYVTVPETYRDAIDSREGEAADVELLETGEARRLYVLSAPTAEVELASNLWRGHAPRSGAELSQAYGEGEVRTMAIEVLPRDYSAVTHETDVVVEGYAGARRVFE
jgi:hypothetical protein